MCSPLAFFLIVLTYQAPHIAWAHEGSPHMVNRGAPLQAMCRAAACGNAAPQCRQPSSRGCDVGRAFRAEACLQWQEVSAPADFRWLTAAMNDRSRTVRCCFLVRPVWHCLCDLTLTGETSFIVS